jgi:hypothetical protein
VAKEGKVGRVDLPTTALWAGPEEKVATAPIVPACRVEPGTEVREVEAAMVVMEGTAVLEAPGALAVMVGS